MVLFGLTTMCTKFKVSKLYRTRDKVPAPKLQKSKTPFYKSASGISRKYLISRKLLDRFLLNLAQLCIVTLQLIWHTRVQRKVCQFPKFGQKCQKPSLLTDLIAFAYTNFL